MTPAEIITCIFRVLTVLVQFITLGMLWYSDYKWEREKKKRYEDRDSDRRGRGH